MTSHYLFKLRSKDSKEKNQIKLTLSNVDLAICNAVRRIILSEIPTVGFNFKPYEDNNSSHFILNNTSLDNEYLAHRFSCVPICLKPDEITNFSSKNYYFRLFMENETNSIINVTTKDIEIYKDENYESKYSAEFHNQVFPENKLSKSHILLTRLKHNTHEKSGGDKLKVNLTAVKDVAMNYAGFSPVSICSHSFDINETDENIAEITKKMENAELSNDEKKDKRNHFETIEKHKYFHKNVYNEPNKITFIVESKSYLSPEYIFFKGLDILYKKIENIKILFDSSEGVISELIDEGLQLTNEKNNASVVIKITDNNMHTIKVYESHTLGNLFQALMYNYYKREEKSNYKLKFVGYRCPHPRENIMLLSFMFEDDDQVDIKEFMNITLQSILQELEILILEYVEYSGLTPEYALDVSPYFQNL